MLANVEFYLEAFYKKNSLLNVVDALKGQHEKLKTFEIIGPNFLLFQFLILEKTLT